MSSYFSNTSKSTLPVKKNQPGILETVEKTLYDYMVMCIPPNEGAGLEKKRRLQDFQWFIPVILDRMGDSSRDGEIFKARQCWELDFQLAASSFQVSLEATLKLEWPHCSFGGYECSSKPEAAADMSARFCLGFSFRRWRSRLLAAERSAAGSI